MAEHQHEPGKTLAASSAAGDLPQSSPQPLISSALPGSGSEPSQEAGTLTRNTSSSKLNAKAPEFVPTKIPPAPRIPDPRMVIVPTPPPSPPPMAPGMLHVYAAAAPPPGPPIHVPVPPSTPTQLHPNTQHQQQQMQFLHAQHHPLGLGHHLQQKRSGGEQELVAGQSQQDAIDKDHQSNEGSRIGLAEESFLKILNQVEYYFSDVNLATTDHLMRFINKDPEGYVPMSVVASFKKIKALINSNSQLAAVLRNSTKLVVSEDGKRVKRVNHLAGSDVEEVQCRIVVAENLPDDHCYQNLMKIFSAVGSVKSIRTCQPQTQNANSGATTASKSSKPDNVIYSSKVHAFVEYETIDLAEKAVAELNKEGDWRNGLRVRLLHKRQPKTHRARGKRAGSEGEATTEDEGTSISEQAQTDKQFVENSGQLDAHSPEQIEQQGNDKEGGQKKGRNHGARGRGRGRGGQNHHHHQSNNRGQHHVGSPPTSFPLNDNDHPPVVKQPPPPGPRMPDGTRGFAVGRGKPVTVNTA